jgi:hypothetical protein
MTEDAESARVLDGAVVVKRGAPEPRPAEESNSSESVPTDTLAHLSRGHPSGAERRAVSIK